jgi:hypothetical protein
MTSRPHHFSTTRWYCSSLPMWPTRIIDVCSRSPEVPWSECRSQKGQDHVLILRLAASLTSAVLGLGSIFFRYKYLLRIKRFNILSSSSTVNTSSECRFLCRLTERTGQTPPHTHYCTMYSVTSVFNSL